MTEPYCPNCRFIAVELEMDITRLRRIGGCWRPYCANSRAYWLQRLADALSRLQPPEDDPPVYARLIPL